MTATKIARALARLPSRLLPLRTLPLRAADLAGTRASRLGERRGSDRLVYNPLTMWSYHRLALRDADPVMAAIGQVFPQAVEHLDVGAGSGAYAAAGVRRGMLMRALERSAAARAMARAQRVRALPFDLRSADAADHRADLAYCFEVAEHLEPELGERLVAFLAGAAPVVVFTAAQPGQGGYGHVNEQPPEYWERRFQSAGMRPAPEDAEALRRAFAANGVAAPWFERNVQVFRRSSGGGAS